MGGKESLKKLFLLLGTVLFSYLAITPPLWRKMWPFILPYLITLYPRILCAKFGWNDPVVLEKSFKSYLYISIIIFLKRGQGSSFEWNWRPVTQGCSVPSLVEIGLVVLMEVMNVFSLFDYYLHLTKDMVHHLKQIRIVFT